MDKNQGSRYQFLERNDGFLVCGLRRETVRVTLRPRYFLVETAERDVKVGFYRYRALVSVIASGLMCGWTPDANRLENFPVVSWAIDQTERSINTRTHHHWRRMLAHAEPQILAVQKAIFSAAFAAPKLALSNQLYKNQNLVNDIIQYQAAAKATLLIEEAMARNGGIRIGRAMDQMVNWMGLYSPSGSPYPCLRKTLMNLPGQVPAHLLLQLRELKLPRALSERVEILMAAYLDLSIRQRRANPECPDRSLNAQVFLHADRLQIREAMRKVSSYTNKKLTFKRAKDIGFVFKFLSDYPYQHNGDLVSLADKSIGMKYLDDFFNV